MEEETIHPTEIKERSESEEFQEWLENKLPEEYIMASKDPDILKRNLRFSKLGKKFAIGLIVSYLEGNEKLILEKLQRYITIGMDENYLRKYIPQEKRGYSREKIQRSFKEHILGWWSQSIAGFAILPFYKEGNPEEVEMSLEEAREIISKIMADEKTDVLGATDFIFHIEKENEKIVIIAVSVISGRLELDVLDRGFENHLTAKVSEKERERMRKQIDIYQKNNNLPARSERVLLVLSIEPEDLEPFSVIRLPVEKQKFLLESLKMLV